MEEHRCAPRPLERVALFNTTGEPFFFSGEHGRVLGQSSRGIGLCLITQPSIDPIVRSHQSKQVPANKEELSIRQERISEMRLSNKIKEAGATGYILLWLLGIPIPILLLIFLLRGCT
jgi:hypothetical protein